MQVSHRHHMIGTDRSIGVWWRAATEVAVSIETDARRRYSNFAEHPLHNWVGHDRCKGPGHLRHDIAVFVLTQRTPCYRQRLYITQWRRDIELHHRQHAAKFGLHNRG